MIYLLAIVFLTTAAPRKSAAEGSATVREINIAQIETQ
jgi:hypothetical protein